MKNREIAGTVVAVTGAANGIGAAIAKALARAGAQVALGDLDVTAVEETAGRIGYSAKGFELDVTSSTSFAKFLDSVESSCGAIDVLVNNAGVMWVGPFADEPERAAERQIAVKPLGCYAGCEIDGSADGGSWKWAYRHYCFSGKQIGASW